MMPSSLVSFDEKNTKGNFLMNTDLNGTNDYCESLPPQLIATLHLLFGSQSKSAARREAPATNLVPQNRKTLELKSEEEFKNLTCNISIAISGRPKIREEHNRRLNQTHQAIANTVCLYLLSHLPP